MVCGAATMWRSQRLRRPFRASMRIFATTSRTASTGFTILVVSAGPASFAMDAASTPREFVACSCGRAMRSTSARRASGLRLYRRVHELDDREFSEVPNSIQSAIALCDSKDVGRFDAQRLGEQNSNHTAVGHDGNRLSAVARAQIDCGGGHASIHFVEALTAGKAGIGRMFHPLSIQVGIRCCDFVVGSTLEFAEVGFAKGIDDFDAAAMR